jgi:ferritin-like metal-binding protein YciE
MSCYAAWPSAPATRPSPTWLAASAPRSARWRSAWPPASTAVEASLREKEAEDIGAELVSYLTDAHAIESQALQLLETGPSIAGFDELAEVFREHLEETREQRRLVEERLRAHDASPSRFQSTGMRIGAINMGGFFAAQPDTPVKLAGFAYAFEHLEIASYELLRRVADRAGDPETSAVAERILVQERHAAERIAATWDAAIDAALEGLVSESPSGRGAG